MKKIPDGSKYYKEWKKTKWGKRLLKIREIISGFNLITGIRWPESITALSAFATGFATIVLVVVTCFYVSFTRNLVAKQAEQIAQQQNQFELINRAKVLIGFPVGDVNRINLSFVNGGNLPAEDFKATWKIIKVQNGEIIKVFPEPSEHGLLSQDKKEVASFSVVDPEESRTLICSSELQEREEFVLLVACWRYKGNGIKGYRSKNQIFFWNIYNKPNPAWTITTILDSATLKAGSDMALGLEKELNG